MSSGGQSNASQTPFAPNYGQAQGISGLGAGLTGGGFGSNMGGGNAYAQKFKQPSMGGQGYGNPFGGFGGGYDQGYGNPFSGFGGGYDQGYGNPFSGFGGGYGGGFGFQQPQFGGFQNQGPGNAYARQNPYQPPAPPQVSQQPPPGFELNPEYRELPPGTIGSFGSDSIRYRPIQGANPATGILPSEPLSDPNAGKVKNPYYYDRFANGAQGTADVKFSDSEYINPEELKNYENRLERNKNTTARYEELKNTPITDAQRNSAMYTLAANKGYNRVGEGATDPNTVMNFLKENNIDYSDDALRSYRSPSDFGLYSDSALSNSDYYKELQKNRSGGLRDMGPRNEPPNRALNPGFRGNFSDYGDAMRNQGIGFGNPYGGYGAPYGGNPYMGMFGGLGSLFGGNGFQGMNQQARAQQAALQNQNMGMLQGGGLNEIQSRIALLQSLGAPQYEAHQFNLTS
jgi:hypothetical protein